MADIPALAAVLGMAVATYATRIGGFLLVARGEPSPFLRRFLDEVPGATFAAICAPLLASGGPVE